MLKKYLKSLLFCISVISAVCLFFGTGLDLWLSLVVSMIILWPVCYERYGW